MLQVVPGQDREWTLCVKTAVQQSLTKTTHQSERLRVGERTPFPERIALGKEYLSGCFARPVHEALAELGRMRAERMRRTHQDRAVVASIEDRIRRTQRDFADREVLRGHCRDSAVPDRV